MASVGDQLLQPEAGWRRYDDSSGQIKFIGGIDISSSSAYQGRYQYANFPFDGKRIEFDFVGTKLRIIDVLAQDRVLNGVKITIDGVSEIYNTNSNTVNWNTLVYEKLNLSNSKHKVIIEPTNLSQYTSNNYFSIDAIDIDSTGELLSLPPPTTGKLCNTLDKMDIGDYIVWKRDGNTHSFGGNIDGYIEIPVTGVASSSLPTRHFHYAIKVDTGLLISDRVTEHSISWDTLNLQKRIQGLPTTISGVSGVIRSLTGGVAYASEYGNRSMTNLNKGCFPTNNEWDKYIINFPKSKIQSGKLLDDVWHYVDIYTLTQETASNGIYVSSSGTSSATVNSTFRTMRGKSGIWGDLGIRQSGNSGTDGGLRLVFEWREV